MKKKYIIILFIIIAWLTIMFVMPNKVSSISKPLTIAFDSKILSGDPRLIGSDAGSQYIEELRFLPLISFDKNGSKTNVLADKIEIEGTHVLVALKKNVHFSTGSEITAYDVKSTYDAILNPKEGFPASPRKGAFANVDSIDVLTSYVVRFNLKTVDATFLNNLTVGILPREIIAIEPIGSMAGKFYESGPFCLTKITETEWHFVANKKYDFADKPKLKEFIIKIIPDSSTRYSALIKGDIDFIQNSLDPDKVYLIENRMNDKFQVFKNTRMATTYIGFNFKDPIIQNKDVRIALAHALDRESILKYRLRSDESPATGLFPDSSFYYDPNLPMIPYQKDLAKEYLEKSKLSLPINLTLSVPTSNKTTVEIAKTMAVNFREIGLNIRVETLENSVFMQRASKGLLQMWIAPWVGYKDPDHLRFIFSSTMVPPYGANRGAYANPQVDALLEAGRTELDTDKRREIYLKAQELLAEDMPYIYLWHGTNVAIMSNRVEGFEIYADGRYWGLVNTRIK